MSQDEQPTAARRSADDSDPGELLAAPNESQEKVKSSRRRNRKAFVIMAAALGLVLAIVAGFAIFYVKSANDALSNINREQMLPQQPGDGPTTGGDPQKAGENSSLNILIMGSDARSGDEQGRSDVLMMVHISEDRKHVYLISFPRDMWVEVPGHGDAKINAAYAWGGVPLTIQTVQNLTGAPIDHAALIDFEGFMSVIDTIGGVDVYNFAASSSRGFDFPEGNIHLNGEQALIYTRERYDLPNGDLDRARRQRDVVMAVVKKMLTPEVLADPAKFAKVLNTTAPYFTVDESFTNSEITKLALSMRITEGDALRSLQAPLSGFGTSADGQSIDLVDTEKMAELSDALHNDQMDAYWQAHRNDPPVPR